MWTGNSSGWPTWTASACCAQGNFLQTDQDEVSTAKPDHHLPRAVTPRPFFTEFWSWHHVFPCSHRFRDYCPHTYTTTIDFTNSTKARSTARNQWPHVKSDPPSAPPTPRLRVTAQTIFWHVACLWHVYAAQYKTMFRLYLQQKMNSDRRRTTSNTKGFG